MVARKNFLRAGALFAGKYRIARVIGEGGMGTVVLAHHTELDQLVAMKFLQERLASDGPTVARFLREARAAAKLQSEHAVRVMDVGKLDDVGPFIVMEYLQGQDLGALLATRGPLRAADAVDYLLESIDAIAEAHAVGIVHRDLKPSNLFLAERKDGSRIIKVLDFGVSKELSGGAAPQLTTSRTALGTPVYMPPEQLRNSRDVDPRADVWSLGVVLYELLTGALPFEGETAGEVVSKILSEDPLSLRARSTRTPPPLETVVRRCLKRERDERFANAAELAQALAPLGTGRADRQVARAASLLRSVGAAPESTTLRLTTPSVIVEGDATTRMVPTVVLERRSRGTQGSWGVGVLADGPYSRRAALAAAGGVAVALMIVVVALMAWSRRKESPAAAATDHATSPVALTSTSTSALAAPSIPTPPSDTTLLSPATSAAPQVSPQPSPPHALPPSPKPRAPARPVASALPLPAALDSRF